MSLQDKKVLVAVSGGIAAFKAAAVARELGRRGARVRVALTPSATRFIGPVTFTGLTGEPALTDLWDPSYPGEMHVALAEWADAIVVAPATANLLARAAHGFADDLVLATLSCAACPVLLAPAMHERMWQRPATRRNVALLQQDGYHTVGPVEGKLANGAVGHGRMAEPDAIVDALALLVARIGAPSDLAGKTVLISAGPTLEDLDPVRFISNRSSGKMGHALCAAARDRGAHVVLVTGPTHLTPPTGIEVIQVRSALEMRDAITTQLDRADVVIMTAAIADYRPAERQTHKIKKSGDTLQISLIKNPDILAELGQGRRGAHPVLIGFAMETRDVAAYGRKKLEHKRVDMIVANEASVAFGGDTNQATLVTHAGDDVLPPMTKLALSHRILDQACRLLARPSTTDEKPARMVKKNRPARPQRAPAPVRPRKGRSPSKV
ncbi:MAG: bifunctional phosphopantothenoylcysteine decarboxylase/phosphopantothenate--cysteine ligase CoaBC [Polyangiales bacterium]